MYLQVIRIRKFIEIFTSDSSFLLQPFDTWVGALTYPLPYVICNICNNVGIPVEVTPHIYSPAISDYSPHNPLAHASFYGHQHFDLVHRLTTEYNRSVFITIMYQILLNWFL